MAIHKRMYKNSPRIEKDEEGKPKVTKAEKESAEVNAGTEDVVKDEGMPIAARHLMERQTMYSKHESDHAIHDHGKAGAKDELHGRHEKELKELHKRHQAELGGGETGGEEIADIKKTK